MSKIYCFGEGLCECGQEFELAYVYLNEEDRKYIVGKHVKIPAEVQSVDVVMHGVEFVCRSCLKPYRLPPVETVESKPQVLDEWVDEHLIRKVYRSEIDKFTQILRRQFNKLKSAPARGDAAIFSENLEKFSWLRNTSIYGDFFWDDVKVILKVDPLTAKDFYERGIASRKARKRKDAHK